MALLAVSRLLVQGRESSTRLSAWLGAAALAAMAVVSFADVALRLLGRPITGAYELTAILVGMVVYATLPLASAQDAHVRAGVLGVLVRVGPGVGAALLVLRRVLTVGVLAYLAWAMLGYMRRVGEAGDRAPYIELPLAWVAAFGVVTLALAAWCAWAAQPEAEGDAAQPADAATAGTP